jgi:hypothetical protein
MRRLLLAICILAPTFLFLSLAEAALTSTITAVPELLTLLLLGGSLVGMVVMYRRRVRMK